GGDGAWIRVTYAQMLARVRRIAAGLLTRPLSAERPIVILSGNSIEHLTLALAAMWAGIPYCPVSTSYSQASGDLARLGFVLDLLSPGMIAAFDTPRYARALSRVPDDVEIIGDAHCDSRGVSTLDSLERPETDRAVEAHFATNADTIVRFLLTSESTETPKAVITTNRMCCATA